MVMRPTVAAVPLVAFGVLAGVTSVATGWCCSESSRLAPIVVGLFVMMTDNVGSIVSCCKCGSSTTWRNALGLSNGMAVSFTVALLLMPVSTADAGLAVVVTAAVSLLPYGFVVNAAISAIFVEIDVETDASVTAVLPVASINCAPLIVCPVEMMFSERLTFATEVVTGGDTVVIPPGCTDVIAGSAQVGGWQ